MKEQCTLTDAELIEAAQEWVSKLAKSGGKDWSLQVPVNFNRDPDMLFLELCTRLAANKWISVEDRLPEIGVDVLVARNDAAYLISHYYNVRGEWIPFGTAQPRTGITHWQPLPEPPNP